MNPSVRGREGIRRRLVGLVLAMAMIAAACGDDDASSERASDSATPTTGATSTPSTTAALIDTSDPSDDSATVESVDCTSVPTGVSTFVLDAGGAEHDVRIYVPTTFDGSSDLALVMNFHGFIVTGDIQAGFSGYEPFAETEGFIVVHPTAVPPSGDTRNSWELAEFDDPAKDDVAFTNALLDLLIQDYCVDESRVYATGMSGGGLFTSRLVCEMSDRIAAASAVAAISHPETCAPTRGVPFMAIHGTEDEVVPFDGDLTGTRFEDEAFAQQLLSVPIPDEFADFAGSMGCDSDGDRVQQSTDIVVTTYRGCDDGVPLLFYEVINGGHAWPSSPVSAGLAELQGYITFEIDATADSWAFFEQHTLES